MATPRATAQQICVMVLKKLGVVNRRAPANPLDIQECLEGFWMLLDSFNTQGALIPFYKRVTLTLTDARVYTIGPGGDLDMDPPMELLDAQIDDGSGYLRPVRIVQGINCFNTNNPGSDSINMNPTQLIWNESVPCHTIELNTVPVGNTLVLYVKMPWSIDASSGSVPSNGVYASSSDYTISIDESADAYCNDECQLNVTQQMIDWIDTQVDTQENSYEHTFDYNGLQVPAIATLSSRISPNATALYVPKDMEFPMGYSPLFLWCLSEQMLTQYPQNNPMVVQEIKEQAKIHRRNIKTKNAKPAGARVDPSYISNQYGGSRYLRR